MEIVGQSVVLHDAPIFLLVLSHDAEERIVDQFPAVNRFTVAEIALVFFSYHVRWHFQSDLPVNASVTALIELSVVVERHDFIAEKARSTGPRVGDERFGFGEFQLEVLAQERSNFALNRSWLWQPPRMMKMACGGTIEAGADVR